MRDNWDRLPGDFKDGNVYHQMGFLILWPARMITGSAWTCRSVHHVTTYACVQREQS